MRHSLSDIANYYDISQFYYSHFWSPDALHYGFWYRNTKNITEAVRNTNQFVIDALAIDSADSVLDAGCGVGGTSIYVAERTGARVAGITLSDVQLRIAREKAARSPAAKLLEISNQDYTHTRFQDESFSKIFGIESICHADRKIDFLREAFRIMRPGGRIAVVDAFLSTGNLDTTDRNIYNKVLEGWIIPNLSRVSQFYGLLEKAGFDRVAFYDMQRCVEKSIMRIYRCSFLTRPIDIVKSRLGIGRENLAARYQMQMFKRRIATYGAFFAHKSG